MNKLALYLDIDGVLNNTEWENQILEEEGYYPLDRNELCPQNIVNLLFIVETLEQYFDTVDIILSSSWRWESEMTLAAANQLANYGLFILDKTEEEINTTISRSEEIRRHLNSHPQYKNFLILDDMPIDEDLSKYHIQTTLTYGLTDKLAKKAIELFY